MRQSYLLKVIADSKGITPSKKYFTINDLLTELTTKLPRDYPFQGGQTFTVWRRFATFPRRGKAPSESVLEDCHVFTQAFMRKSLRRFLRRDFDNLDMIDFIQSSKAKKMLRFAKLNLSSKSYFDSRTPAKLAFVIISKNLFSLFPRSPSFTYFNAKSQMLFAEQMRRTGGQAIVMNAANRPIGAEAGTDGRGAFTDNSRPSPISSNELDEVKAYLALVSLGRLSVN